jgi:hypothetical protein
MVLFIVAQQFAQMLQNLFLITTKVEKKFLMSMYLVAWEYAKMHQNLFETTLNVKNNLFTT